MPAAESPGASPAARATVEEIKSETASARNRAVQGRYADTWKRFGLRQVKPAIKHDFECAVASTGQVRASFARDPCRSMTRRLELLVDDQGRLAVVSIAWVRMYGIEPAIRLQDLAETPGAGWVLPLNGELVGHPEIRFGVEHRVVSRRNSIVKFSDSVPVSGIADPTVLDGLSDVASEFPDPDP